MDPAIAAEAGVEGGPGGWGGLRLVGEEVDEEEAAEARSSSMMGKGWDGLGW